MSFVDTLRQWDEAVTCADRQDWSEALSIFLSIEQPNSKICFDIGCLHLLNQELDAAEKVCLNGKVKCRPFLPKISGAFDCSIRKDEHLAVAFFQRGVTFYKKERQKQKLFKLVEFPSKTLFKPNKHYVAELEKKDYLGKAKVVASVVPQDEFSGFAPLQPQDMLFHRALEGEAHTVLFEFVPETSDELAVVPGNIVFVLQKGADNWAYVVFNERDGLITLWCTTKEVR
ncbi:hypothetical protein GOODEAATRI_005946 [Goodea atripinnis]|uniref:SH3 domain-containing protein n=1 Tax=Goodea atripinnis TaxID=208336 RepID=A0ABV0P203_9TELE